MNFLATTTGGFISGTAVDALSQFIQNGEIDWGQAMKSGLYGAAFAASYWDYDHIIKGNPIQTANPEVEKTKSSTEEDTYIPPRPPKVEVTEDLIKEVMKDAPLQTQQGTVSMPAIQNYVDRILANELDIPPIKVDGNIIVDGNHRYIAARITGVEVPIQNWPGGRPNNIVSWSDVTLDPTDWGNR